MVCVAVGFCMQAVHARFFPDGVWEEHRDYLVTQLDRPDQVNKQHAFMGNYRKPDEVVYFGDRRPIHGKNATETRRREVRVMYESKKDALQSVHSTIAWKGVLGK